MTFHLDSHTITDVKPDMLSGVQIGNGIPHDRCNIQGIAHVHKKQNKKFCFFWYLFWPPHFHVQLPYVLFCAIFQQKISISKQCQFTLLFWHIYMIYNNWPFPKCCKSRYLNKKNLEREELHRWKMESHSENAWAQEFKANKEGLKNMHQDLQIFQNLFWNNEHLI